MPPVIVVASERIQIRMTAQLLHPPRIPIRRIQSRRNRTVTHAVGTHHFVYPRCGTRLSDEIIDGIPAQSMPLRSPIEGTK